MTLGLKLSVQSLRSPWWSIIDTSKKCNSCTDILPNNAALCTLSLHCTTVKLCFNRLSLLTKFKWNSQRMNEYSIMLQISLSRWKDSFTSVFLSKIIRCTSNQTFRPYQHKHVLIRNYHIRMSKNASTRPLAYRTTLYKRTHGEKHDLKVYI